MEIRIALTLFKDVSFDLPVFTASDNDLQAILNDHQCNQILSSLNIW